MTTELDIVESRDAALARTEATNAIQVAPPQTVEAAIAHAIVSNTDPEALGKMLDVYERMEARRAAQAFAKAYAAFKAECPPIVRRTENSQFKVTRNGTQANRKYASLEDIATTIDPVLARHGLTYYWSDAILNEGGLTMQCVVQHEDGHSKTASATFPIDSKAGASDQQKRGIAMTYCQRYSLVSALGLTSCDEDADGAMPRTILITEKQAADLEMLIDEVKPDMARFRQHFGIENIADMPAVRFKEAVRLLEARRKAGQ